MIRKFYSILLLIAAFCFAVISAEAQQRGTFETSITFESGMRAIACYVPNDYNSSESYPLIIGMHPGAQTPEWVMRDMMKPAAEQLKAILVCPQDFQYNGQIIPRAIEWAKDEYNIDPEAVIITGYSAGGNHTFMYSFANPDVVRGIVGIAPSVNYFNLNYSATKKLPVAMICGQNDPLLANCEAIEDNIEAVEGHVKLIVKQGVGHTGAYFYGPEFATDWIECYDFIFDIVPAPDQVQLLTPDDDAENLEAPFNFEWEEMPGADSYRIEIAENYDFKTLTEFKETTGTNYTATKLEPGILYYWQVVAINDGGSGQWSSIRSFTTMPEAPDEIVDIIFPVDDAENIPVSVTFEWQNIDAADFYHFQLRKDGEDTPLVDEENIEAGSGASTEFSVDELDNLQKYNWRVRGGNAGGWGEWNESQNFTTVIAAPETSPGHIFPEDESEDNEIEITFRWNAVETATAYEFELEQMEPTPQIILSTEFNSENEDVIEYDVSDLQENTEYRWRLKAMNEGGDSGWSEYWTFTTGTASSVEYGGESFFRSYAYPNPSENFVRINFYLTNISKVRILIVDQRGAEITSMTKEYLTPGEHALELNTAALAGGVYLYKIQSGKQLETGRIIITK